MKIFKKLATLSMALTFVLGLGALTACKGDDSIVSSSSVETSSEESKNYTCYEFIVLDKDGNKVGDGYQIYLCTADDTNCFSPIPVTNGVCAYNEAKITAPGEFVVHAMKNYQVVELKKAVTTSANAFGEYTIQLAE